MGFDITTTPKMTQEINSILDRFGNQVKYIRDPYSAADAFAVPALQARGRSDVQVLSDAPSHASDAAVLPGQEHRRRLR